MLFIYIGHTYFFTRFRQFIMSYKNHFVVSQMLYLIFFMGKKPRENYCNGKIKKKTSNKLSYSIKIHGHCRDHSFHKYLLGSHYFPDAGNAEMNYIIRVPFFMELMVSTLLPFNDKY